MDVDEKAFTYCFGNYLNGLEFTPELLLTDHDFHICLNIGSQPTTQGCRKDCVHP
jgi:hypothetical protein